MAVNDGDTFPMFTLVNGDLPVTAIPLPSKYFAEKTDTIQGCLKMVHNAITNIVGGRGQKSAQYYFW